MGQAKRKAAQLEQWESGLTVQERVIHDTARALHAKLVKPLGLTGACYRLAFFLTAFLQQEHGIKVVPVVGYSNDGTGPIMASHAWIEFGGKKTDISVAITENTKIYPPGPLLILDRPVSTGTTTYTYHQQQDAAAIEEKKIIAAHPTYGAIAAHKRIEHQKMTAIAPDIELILDYLNAAPDGLTYEKFKAYLKA